MTTWRAREPAVQDRGRAARSRPTRTRSICIYQTLVGAWPFDARRGDADGVPRADRRVHDQGAARGEGPHQLAEPGRGVRDGGRAVRRRDSRSPAAEPVPRSRSSRSRRASPSSGIYNSLAQLLIKITAPGVPDFYQGTELWDLNLVDPDNRRPVDYDDATRSGVARPDAARDAPDRCGGRCSAHRDRRPHQDVRHPPRARGARPRWRDLYEQGDYVPLQTAGARRDACSRSPRRQPDRTRDHLRAAAGRVADARRGAPPLGRGVWDDTRD